MRATPRLLDLMAGTPIVPVRSIEVLELRDEDHNPIDYRETRQTCMLRRQVEEMNQSLSSVRLSIDHPAVQHISEHSILVGPELCREGTDVVCMREPDPYLKRIFCRGCWRKGGRFYASFQQLPSAVRSELRINDEPVVLLDFTAMHTTILYNQAGIELDGDPYDIAGLPREEVKLGLNIAYNAPTLCGARSALALKLAERDGRDVATKPDHARAALVIAAICEKHTAIGSAFGSDNGVDIQFSDSEIIREILAKCTRQGIPALPVHDEVIAPARCEDRVAELMIQTFEEREPGPNKPKIKTLRASGETGSKRG
jgi:hypothetical protein